MFPTRIMARRACTRSPVCDIGGNTLKWIIDAFQVSRPRGCSFQQRKPRGYRAALSARTRADALPGGWAVRALYDRQLLEYDDDVMDATTGEERKLLRSYRYVVSLCSWYRWCGAVEMDTAFVVVVVSVSWGAGTVHETGVRRVGRTMSK